MPLRVNETSLGNEEPPEVYFPRFREDALAMMLRLYNGSEIRLTS